MCVEAAAVIAEGVSEGAAATTAATAATDVAAGTAIESGAATGSSAFEGAAATDVASGTAIESGGLTGSSPFAGAPTGPVGPDFGSIFNGIKSVSSVLSPIMSLAQASSGVSAARRASLSAGSPQIASPIAMPTIGSADTLNTLRSSIQEQMVRRGRAATILTSPDSGDRLGS